MNHANNYNQLVRFYNRSRKKLQSLIIERKNFRKQGILKKRIVRLIKTISDLQKVLKHRLAFIALCSGFLLLQSNTAHAQISFNPIGENPFDLIELSRSVTPTLADIDDDGDLDIISGEDYGNFKFFQNIGTVESPTFSTVITNPFGLADIGGYTNPAFCDLDNDGDQDLMVGLGDGNFWYFQNIGTAGTPAFDDAIFNPFDLIDIGAHSVPTFADLDNDGDKDLMSGSDDGNYKYFQNTGTAETPIFAAVLTNPFGLVYVANDSHLTFADLDSDGDLDLVAGVFDYYSYYGNFKYFENTGTPDEPVFAEAITNPFGLINIIFIGYAAPTFADLDNDGDMDIMSGSGSQAGIYGTFFYFENTTPPCTLVNFYADTDDDEYGDVSSTILACYTPDGYTPDSTDCNDSNPLVYPGATELLNGVDDNCNGEIDEGLVSINSIENNLLINIFPNPVYSNGAVNVFNIEINSANLTQQQIRISITNILGEEVLNKTLEMSNGKLSEKIIFNQSSGVYIIKIITGENQYEKKIMIE